MKSEKTSTAISFPSLPVIILGIVGTIIIAGVPFFVWSYDSWYEGKIMPGVYLGSHDVGEKSKEYVKDLLDNYDEQLRSTGVVFTYRGKNITLLPEIIPLGSDIPTQASDPLFDVDVDKTVLTLYSVGRDGSFVQQQLDRSSTAVTKKYIPPTVIYNEYNVVAALKKELSFFQTPPHDAHFTVSKNGSLSITPESSGIEFNYEDAMREMKNQFDTFTLPRVTLKERVAQPSIREAQLTPLMTQAQHIIARAPLTLFIEQPPADPASSSEQKKEEWVVSGSTLASWIVPIQQTDGTIVLNIDKDHVAAYLKKELVPKVLVEVQHPKFEMKDGRVMIIDKPQDGRALDVDATSEMIIKALAAEGQNRIALAVKATESPYLHIADGEPVIKELIMSNKTSFTSSPKNRKANIARGAALINGLLIAPNETFSLIKALGAIDDTNGFLPELVIKGNKTTPEFGGGLCQVSTTLFRAVSYAGLPVVERHNHSYRVPYYEPPIGFDATIYSPAPDFKFKNDTGNYILIQTEINKSTITVELWGTKDGRKVEVDKPTVFNIKKAGNTKIIETTDLKPGEKKCTEKHAHDGADAFFERRVTMPDGTLRKETYKSHYVVWPAVCLVGKAADPNEQTPPTSAQPDTTAASTAPVKDTNPQPTAVTPPATKKQK